MRGNDVHQQPRFSYVSLESPVPADHPLRRLRGMVDQVLRDLSAEFAVMYSRTGRPSIVPEQLLRALLLQVLYTVRRQRLLMEELDDNLLFRWFVGLSMDEAVWDHSTFTRNRDRSLSSNVAGSFCSRVGFVEAEGGLLAGEHFTVDGTLIESWASMKSFRPKDKSDDRSLSGSGHDCAVDFHGEKRRNETHEPTTDREARLYWKGKGKESRLTYMRHAVMQNRHGLVVDTRVTGTTRRAAREAATPMVCGVSGRKRLTLRGDKGYDTADFIQTLRGLKVTPHPAQNNTRRRSAIDRRTVRHPGYAVRQRIHKRVEEMFGWIQTIGNLRRTRHRGLERVAWMFTSRPRRATWCGCGAVSGGGQGDRLLCGPPLRGLTPAI